MSFLTPAILAGLAAVAIPLWVHLTNRERSDVVSFPSLMFLEKIPYRAIRRQKVRHWLLLAARCLALALLVAAFARPVLDRTPLAAAGGTAAREVAVLVDRSYSMAHGDRWEQALTAARRFVGSLGPEDRASLVFFDQGARAAVRSSLDRARLRAALDTARVGSGVTRFAPALKLAGTIMETSDRGRREVVLISDFQERGWAGTEDFQLPSGVGLVPAPVGAEIGNNALVATVGFRRELVQGRERVTATARVQNRGADTLRSLPVTLELDGRETETLATTLAPGETGALTFGAFTLSEADTRGVVRIPEDALPTDDALHFVLSPGEAVSVLVLEEGRRPRQSLFLRRALEIGESPVFQVEVEAAAAFRPGDLAGRDVVVLNGAPFPRDPGGEALASFVESGGGLLVALGERSAFAGSAERVMPGDVAGPRDRDEGRGGTLSSLEYSHPVFELFRDPRSGDFSGSRFFRYRPLRPDPRLTARGSSAAGIGEEGEPAGRAEVGEGPEPSAGPSSDDPEVTVLARFDDGAPALVERRAGAGRVLVWTSTLDSFWNDLPLQPIFLPFVHRMGRYLAEYREPTPWLGVGQVLALGDAGDAPREEGTDVGTVASLLSWDEGDRIARTPSGAILTLPPGGEGGFLPLEEHGFYEIRRPGESGGALATLAVNPDLSESELEPLDPEELARAVTAPGAAPALAGGAEGTLGPADREQRQALWRYLLVTAFLLLAVETVASNRLSRAARSVVGPLGEGGSPRVGSGGSTRTPRPAAGTTRRGRAGRMRATGGR